MKINGSDFGAGQMPSEPTSRYSQGSQMQGHPGFYPMAYFGFPYGMMPPYAHQHHKKGRSEHVRFSEPEISASSSAEDTMTRKPTKLPHFAKVWFRLHKDKKEEVRRIRQQWVTSQKEAGNPNPEHDIEGMKSVMPWFAAKWFALSEDEKEYYRQMKKDEMKPRSDSEPEVSGYSSTEDDTSSASPRIPFFAKIWFRQDKAKKDQLREIRDQWIASQKAIGTQSPEKDVDGMKSVLPRFAAKWFALNDEEKEKCRSAKQQQDASNDIPPFALKWFELPQSKKCEYRKLQKHDKKTSKPCYSDGDLSEPEEFSTHEVPDFVQKWFELPDEKKKEMRMKYRFGKHSQRPRCGGMRRMMTMAAMRKMRESEGQGHMPFPHHPMMHAYGAPPMMPPATFMAPWMAPHFQQGGAQQFTAPPPPPPPEFFMRRPPMCMMKKLFKATKISHEDDTTATTSDGEEVKDDASGFSSDASESESIEMPPFVKKWFSLPIEARRQLRMLRQHQKRHGKSPADGIPPFASKWFALPEKKKQHWRKINQELAKKTTKKPTGTALAGEEGVELSVPDFAQKWFSLPTQRKHHLRMLHQYLSKKNEDSTDSSEDEIVEQMPDFAAKWFALSQDERRQLRRLNHTESENSDNEKRHSRHAYGQHGQGFHGRHHHHRHGFRGNNPWARWGYFTQPMM